MVVWGGEGWGGLGAGAGEGRAGRMDYAPCSGQCCGSRRSTPGLQGRRAAASAIGRPFGNWRPYLQRFDSAGALDQRVMGRRCDELAESGSRDFCFSTRVGFGSLAEDALPLNNASSLSILHRLLGTGLGSLASPIGGAAENAGSSALAGGAPCAANMQCGEFCCLEGAGPKRRRAVYSLERVHLEPEVPILFLSNNSAPFKHANTNGIYCGAS